jgi:aspartate aminotransferase-like enzyme
MIVESLQIDDKEQWCELYQGYADFYKMPMNEDILDTVWSWIFDKEIHNGAKFKDMGMQIAAGVPLKCDEGDDYQTFRIGLFGLDKLKDVDAAVDRLEVAFKQLMA